VSSPLEESRHFSFFLSEGNLVRPFFFYVKKILLLLLCDVTSIFLPLPPGRGAGLFLFFFFWVQSSSPGTFLPWSRSSFSTCPLRDGRWSNSSCQAMDLWAAFTYFPAGMHFFSRRYTSVFVSFEYWRQVFSDTGLFFGRGSFPARPFGFFLLPAVSPFSSPFCGGGFFQAHEFPFVRRAVPVISPPAI